MQPSVFAFGSVPLRHENFLLLRQFSSLGVSSFRFRPDFPVFCKPLISAEQVRGSRLSWFCPAAAAAAAGRAGAAAAAAGRAAAAVVVGGGGSVGEVGEERGFLPENRGGFPLPLSAKPWNRGAGVLLGWAARLPPPPGRLGPGGGAPAHCITGWC